MHIKQGIRKLVGCLLPGLVALAITGCVSQGAAARSAKGKLLQDAQKHAFDLKAQNKLPGYGNPEHGRMIASAPWRGGSVSYPASVIVRAWKEGDDSTYCYTLVKTSPETSWQLVKAARLDRHDHIVARLFPK